MTECGDEYCQRPALPGSKYCSDLCAPTNISGLSEAAKHTGYIPRQETYGHRGDGESCRLSSKRGSPIVSDKDFVDSTIQPGQKKKESEKKSISEKTLARLPSGQPIVTPSTGSGSTKKHGKEGKTKMQTNASASGESGTNKIVKNTFGLSTLEETKEIPLEASIVPRCNSEEEKSQGTNLLNDTTQHLHGLMKSIAKDHPKMKSDPRMVMAACHCAKNIRELMKLKLDIYKESRK